MSEFWFTEFNGREETMRTLITIAIGFAIMATLFICAGNAVEAFTASIDGSNGVAGSSYTINP